MGRPVVGGSADTSDGGGVVSTSGAASATRSDHRIRKIRLSTRAIKSASASVFVARRSPSSLHWALDQSGPRLGPKSNFLQYVDRGRGERIAVCRPDVRGLRAAPCGALRGLVHTAGHSDALLSHLAQSKGRGCQSDWCRPGGADGRSGSGDTCGGPGGRPPRCRPRRPYPCEYRQRCWLCACGAFHQRHRDSTHLYTDVAFLHAADAAGGNLRTQGPCSAGTGLWTGAPVGFVRLHFRQSCSRPGGRYHSRSRPDLAHGGGERFDCPRGLETGTTICQRTGAWFTGRNTSGLAARPRIRRSVCWSESHSGEPCVVLRLFRAPMACGGIRRHLHCCVVGARRRRRDRSFRGAGAPATLFLTNNAVDGRCCGRCIALVWNGGRSARPCAALAAVAPCTVFRSYSSWGADVFLRTTHRPDRRRPRKDIWRLRPALRWRPPPEFQACSIRISAAGPTWRWR